MDQYHFYANDKDRHSGRSWKTNLFQSLRFQFPFRSVEPACFRNCQHHLVAKNPRLTINLFFTFACSAQTQTATTRFTGMSGWRHYANCINSLYSGCRSDSTIFTGNYSWKSLLAGKSNGKNWKGGAVDRGEVPMYLLSPPFMVTMHIIRPRS